MGELGSGRHHHDGAKKTVNDYWSIDVRQWKREGLLVPHQSFPWKWMRSGEVVASMGVKVKPNQVVLSYHRRRREGKGMDEHHPVRLHWTPCGLGGKRVWFLCPACDGGRKVVILYLGPDGPACRHCLDLAYPSQRTTANDRARLRAENIRRKLGWETPILGENGWKPKHMRWSTFARLLEQHDRHVEAAFKQLTVEADRLRKAAGNH